MKKSKKIISVFFAMLLFANMTMSVCAAETQESTEKEENVYITLSADGSVKDIYVVNTFDGGDIVDYGDYNSVKILDTTDEIQQDGDEITFSSSADKVSYQGDLDSSTEIPWNISIRYFLDGKEYNPEELAGESGALEIQLSVTENTAYSGDVYDNYVLQVSFTLDTGLCKNISAVDATISANVGSDKQLTYMVLPGAGIETTITADVTDFEMDAVSINGVQMNLNIEVDDEELLEQITELQDAIGAIDDGAGEVQDGVSALVSGSETLSSGVVSLASGISELDTGIQSLNNGIVEAQTGLDTLNGQSSTLTESSAQIKTTLEGLQQYAANSGDATLQNTINALYAAYSEFDSGLTTYTAGVSQIATNYSQISSGAASLASGSASLVSGSNSLYDGTVEFLDGISELYDGTSELKTGTSELRTETENIDTEIEEQIDELLDSFSGSGDVTSFVSEKNTNVTAVQFVMQTDAIQVAEVETEEEVEEELNFWEKLMNLF